MQEKTKQNKTRRALAYALLFLLEQRPFGKITVNDICEEALISRSAFYVHFMDKYDLLRYALTELRERMREPLSREEVKGALEALLEGFQQRRNLMANLLEDAANVELRDMLTGLIVEEFSEGFARVSERRELALPVEVCSVFYAGGMISLLFWWARSRFALPKEEMARYMMALVERV